VRERRHVGEQPRLDILPGDEQVDRREPTRRIDEILPLDDEEAELLPPPPVAELADELQTLVVA